MARLVQGCEKLAVVKGEKDIVDVQETNGVKFLAMAEDDAHCVH